MRQIRTMLTPAEYLERERVAACKSEYVNGEIQAMAGAISDHDVIYNDRSDTISLTSLNCTLKLADVYEKVEFAA